MDPDAVAGLERVPHGGVDDASVLDFSTTTNPDRPPGIVGVYDAALAASQRYPSDDYFDYRTAAAAHVGCDAFEVIPTAGAMAAIRLAIGVTVDRGESVLVPVPSFGEYAREVRLQGGVPEFVRYDELPEADPAGHAMAIACNPNNPTGDAYETGDLVDFVERCRESGTVVLIDETFLDFTDRPSFAGEPDTVVVRSLTKTFGIPGLRAGFLVAADALRDRLDLAREPWGLSTPAAAVGAHCLEQTEFIERTRERVRTERARMRDRLASSYDVHPSDAPFLLIDVGDRTVAEVVDAARARDIAIRDATMFPGLDAHVRVAVRRPAENDELLAALLSG